MKLESRITRFNPQSRDELDSKIEKDLEMLLGLQNNDANNIKNSIPSQFVLHQNFPNPFNPMTRIRFEIASDVKGQTSDLQLTSAQTGMKIIINNKS